MRLGLWRLLVGLGCFWPLVGVAWAQESGGEPCLLGATNEVTHRIFAEAQSHESAGHFQAAIDRYAFLFEKDSGELYCAGVGLGRVHQKMGHQDEAIEAFAAVLAVDDENDEALLRLAGLLEASDPTTSVRMYLDLEHLRERKTGSELGWAEKNEPLLLRARAWTGVDSDKAVEVAHFYFEYVENGPENEGIPDAHAEIILELASVLRKMDRDDAVLDLLERFVLLAPESALVSRAEIEMMDSRARLRAPHRRIGGDKSLSIELRQRLATAIALRSDESSLEQALTQLEQLAVEAPLSASVWGELAKAYEMAGKVTEAERANLHAVALDSENARWHAQLGLLLKDAYGGRFADMGLESLETAFRLDPSQVTLPFHMAEVHRQRGRWAEAEAAYRLVVEHSDSEGLVADAQEQLRVLEITRSVEQTPVPNLCEAPGDVESACLPLQLALEYWDLAIKSPEGAQAGGMWRERAEEQVQLALEKVAGSQAGMGWAPAHNLLARMAEADGKIDIAVMEWRASLAATEDQPHVWRRLGEALLSFDDQSSTDEGWLALQRAALEGESKACFRLAERHHQAGELSDARRLLSLGFAQSVLEGGTDTPDEVKAATLWAAVAEPPTELVPKSNRLTIFVAIAVALGLSLVFLVQRRGKTLQELVQIAPECAHDLARLLSAIRHEVLKHNTNLLEEVARALEAGDDDAHRRVSFAARQLFGDDETEEGGVIARFYGDLGAIERLALQYGVRVDLRRRDSVLAPMASAMEELMRLAPDLRRPQKARAHVPKLLRALSVRLNEDGYQALGQMVRKISAVDITEIVVRDADARVRAEPDLANKTLPTLHVNVHEEDGISARVFRADLDDILANLLRNAYSALVSGPPQEDPAVWVEVGREVDSSPESFERVVIRVWDTAEGLVTTDMIQRQPIERGLGLVFDLVRRHDGTISVDEGTEDTQTATSRWKKSIVVRLLRVETHIGTSQAVTPVTVEEELLAEDQQIKVLVVEDGHEYSTNLRRFLSEYFRFERAGDGFEALSALEDKTWDVVFLDMRFDRAERLLGDPEPLTERFGGDLERARRLLEDNQGTHILEAIRAAGNHVPVLFSYDFDGEPRRYRNLEQRYGPLGYLPDTAGPAEIRAALNALAKAVG